MVCYCYLRNAQDLLADGKAPCERRFGESFKGPIIPFGAQVEYLRNSERERQSDQFGEKVLLGFFDRCALIAGRICKGDILIADIEELEKLDASKIYPRRQNAKEVLICQKDGEFVFHVADGSAKLSGRDYEFQEPILGRESTGRRENLSGESHCDGEEFRPEETKDDAEIQKDFCSIQGDFIYRHHVERRVQLYVPKEKSITIPMKKIDVMGRHIQIWTLHKKNELTTVGINLSDSWTTFTKFTLLNETPPKGYMWSG